MAIDTSRERLDRLKARSAAASEAPESSRPWNPRKVVRVLLAWVAILFVLSSAYWRFRAGNRSTSSSLAPGWLVMASKFFRNGIDVTGILNSLVEDTRALTQVFPIDTSRTIASGFSGGGMASYDLAELASEQISALVINTGMMSPSLRGPEDKYPKGKIVAYLASPTDFRYREMQADRIWMERHGWRTKWIEFQGGHIPAPDSAYEEAAGWLETQW